MTIRIQLIAAAVLMTVFSVLPAEALTLRGKPKPAPSPEAAPERARYEPIPESTQTPATQQRNTNSYRKKGSGEDLVLLVVPSRRMPVQMAQDMMQIRDNCLVIAYNGRPQDMDPEMFFWGGSKWSRITASDYSQPGSYKEVPEKVLIFGTRKEIPGVVIEGMSWVDDAKYVEKLDILTMVKAFNDEFDFTSGEWRSLARRYGLTLRDNNEGKSRFDRYNNPNPSSAPSATSSSTVSNPQHEMLQPTPLPEPEPLAQPSPVVPEQPDVTPERPDPVPRVSAPPIADLEPVDINAPIK